MKIYTIKRMVLFAGSIAFSLALHVCAVFFLSSPALAGEALIIGDVQYKPIADVVSEIRSTVKSRLKVYSAADVRGRLRSTVEREGARVVVALGKDAVEEALLLPPSTTVIFGLVITPPKTSRPNITGVYMATPASEYINTVIKYLPSIRRISIVGSRYLMNILDGKGYAQVAANYVSSSSELVNTLNRLQESQAILLLPDVAMLTAMVMDNVYLFSYRKNIPLLGISEGHVKQGSLFALVFDPAGLGRQIGEEVLNVLNGMSAGDMPSSPPREFNLFINTNTAEKMGIAIPGEMIRKAKKIYP